MVRSRQHSQHSLLEPDRVCLLCEGPEPSKLPIRAIARLYIVPPCLVATVPIALTDAPQVFDRSEAISMLTLPRQRLQQNTHDHNFDCLCAVS